MALDTIRTVGNVAGAAIGFAENVLTIVTGSLADQKGALMIGGKPLPAVVQDLRVTKHLRTELAPIEGRSGGITYVHGVAPADVEVPLIFVDDIEAQGIAGKTLEAGREALGAAAGINLPKKLSAEDKLAAVEAAFSSRHADGRVRTWLVDNDHLRARGVTAMIWLELASEDVPAMNMIRGTLRFREVEPAVVSLLEERIPVQEMIGPPLPDGQPPADIDARIGELAGAAADLVF